MTFDVIFLILILHELDDEDHSNEQGNIINQRKNKQNIVEEFRVIL